MDSSPSESSRSTYFQYNANRAIKLSLLSFSVPSAILSIYLSLFLFLFLSLSPCELEASARKGIRASPLPPPLPDHFVDGAFKSVITFARFFSERRLCLRANSSSR